jgi:membrane protein
MSAAGLAARVEGTVVGDLLEALRRTRTVDMSYTIAAQAFVALFPLVLVITGAFTTHGDSSIFARELVDRFGLAGAARLAVEQLFTTPASGSGVYWLGLVITTLSVVSLTRRVARAYAHIWELPTPSPRQQWRGLAWLLLQVAMFVLVSGLRDVRRDHGPGVELVALVGLLLVWGFGEYLAQRLLTFGRVARPRLAAAAAVVTVGRAGVVVWSAVYLPGALARQAELYGPIGVVFALFTWIFANVAVLLLCPLLAAVATARPVGSWLRPTDG